jgi:MoaA/NifB/PqqE/SkfB family radical SAM enzyme
MTGLAMRRRWNAAHRFVRVWKMALHGLADRHHVLLAQIVPVRRCNLSCRYCNEYDQVSNPVAAAEMLQRIDKLADLGCAALTFSGGEPMMHPDLAALVARVRERGMIAGLITNGYYLTAETIASLNRNGLEFLQISIDNVEPDDVSKKSLKVLDDKLVLLARHAEFDVNINSVLGGGIRDPQDALVIARRAVALGFGTTVGVIHDGGGQLQPLKPAEREVHAAVRGLGKRLYSRFDRFQEDLVHGRPHSWRCRAGSRYLYVCEDGLVHYCSQQRGRPGIPLLDYSRNDLWREYNAKKACAPQCTVSCVQRLATIDNWRDPQVAPVAAIARYRRRLPVVTADERVSSQGSR